MTTPTTILDIIKAHKEVISLLLQIEHHRAGIKEVSSTGKESTA